MHRIKYKVLKKFQSKYARKLNMLRAGGKQLKGANNTRQVKFFLPCLWCKNEVVINQYSILTGLEQGDSKMFFKKIVLRTFITSLITFTILATNSVYAERKTAPGYVTDSNGKITG